MAADDVLDRMHLRFLVGATASGKSRLGLELAALDGLEIVSLDSMAVYRGMDIGTAKPSAAERARVPHHLIDVADPRERFDLREYVGLVRQVLIAMEERGARPLFVGGTGLYLAALLRGLFEGPPVDPEVRSALELRARDHGPSAMHATLREVDPASAERIHPNDLRRTLRALEVFEQTGRTMSDWQREWRSEATTRESSALIEGIDRPPEEIDERIGARVASMMAAGWPEEALALEEKGGLGVTARQALGYAAALAVARGEIDSAAAVEETTLRTRQFARRQRTWFRKFDVRWRTDHS